MHFLILIIKKLALLWELLTFVERRLMLCQGCRVHK